MVQRCILLLSSGVGCSYVNRFTEILLKDIEQIWL